MNRRARLFRIALVAAPSLIACATGSGSPGETKTVVLGKKGELDGKPAPATPGVNVPAIKIDTVGYPSAWAKVAIFNVEPRRVVVARVSGETVYEVPADNVISRGEDPASKDLVWQVDFSAVTEPGEYVIRGEGAESDPFRIADDIYAEALVAAQKHFYFQRTRTALEKPYAEWKGHAYLRAGISHAHEDVGWDLLDYPEKKRKWKVEGGWHDAGNYDMYIPSTGPTAQALMMAYEASPKTFADGQLNIPESSNGVPDILDEAKWGLLWILSIQEEGGAFRHREAVMEWSPEGPADQDETERWIAGPSTSATAKAVAALALAARVYSRWDPAFAKRCESAAKNGWKFLREHPEHIRVDGKGSQQPLWDDEPEFTDKGARFIAAAEVWRSFRDPTAMASARALLAEKEAQPSEFVKGAWANLSRWALMTLALDSKAPRELRDEARSRLLIAAEAMRDQVETADGYRCATRPDEYYWAHNSNLLEKAHILLVAAKLAPDQEWMVEAARDQWHWILGRNPNGFSMVTQVGKGPTRMYHMEWGAMEPPPPGYLIGGPNSSNLGFLAPGAPAKALLWENPEALRSGVPAHSLWHWHQSDLWDGGFVEEGQWTEGWWAVTEPDIYYNANLVLVGAEMQ